MSNEFATCISFAFVVTLAVALVRMVSFFRTYGAICGYCNQRHFFAARPSIESSFRFACACLRLFRRQTLDPPLIVDCAVLARQNHHVDISGLLINCALVEGVAVLGMSSEPCGTNECYLVLVQRRTRRIRGVSWLWRLVDVR